MKRISISTLGAVVLAVTLTGCSRDNVQVYHVATNETVLPQAPAVASASPAAMPTSMPGDMPAPDNSGQPQLKYTLPDGWKEKPLTQMRVASFTASENGKDADISVVPLGGMSGGDLANVNRWRGQVALPPIDEDASTKSAESVAIADKTGSLYDIAGTETGSGDQVRILGAILHGDDAVWYFKMTGDAALVEKQKPNFIAFLKSVDFGKLPPPSTMDLSKLPASHPDISAMGATAAPATDAGDQPAWTVPAGWQPGQLAQFLVARFVVKGNGDAGATVNVSQLVGDGGGLVPNVNRWRAQLGLPPASDDDIAKLATIDASGSKATVVEISGIDPRSNKPASLVGVVLPLTSQTWFYKLMGDASVVAAQKDAFIKFVQSAKYP
ncbi:MAG TPA: hypothetical protein VK742_06380 [Candidatus Sulfotelmatobacter sp.]|nr:hypothetical protein [Candidatus Sulfotelmatobacter sp.]